MTEYPLHHHSPLSTSFDAHEVAAGDSVFNHVKLLRFHHFFESGEEMQVAWGQVRRVGWL